MLRYFQVDLLIFCHSVVRISFVISDFNYYNQSLRLNPKGKYLLFEHCSATLFKARGDTPLQGLMGTCGQPRYVFRDFCLEQGIEFIIFCLNQGQGMRGRAGTSPPRDISSPPPPGVQSKIILVKKVLDMMSDSSNHDLHETFIKPL